MDENNLYRERAILRHKGNELLPKIEQDLSEAKGLIDPRRRFNNWLRSTDGQEWRKQEFQERGGICAYCGEPMREADAVVHHVKPLAAHGRIANTTENYRLLHPSCNQRIGAKIVKLLF
ncbi:MAG: HNH endonuclease signature motif containing protein [Cyanobacteria bacterium P01_G01_bin.54]